MPRLASNLDPPDLCLMNSADYRCEPLVPDNISQFIDSDASSFGRFLGIFWFGLCQ
jgi:hypothetical protein